MDVVTVQALGIVDHVCRVDNHFLSKLSGGLGGSERITSSEVSSLLASVETFDTSAGGGTSNVVRGLSGCFQLSSRVLATVGKDEWGKLFSSSLERCGIDTGFVSERDGETGRCVSMVGPDGQRTMRVFGDPAMLLQPSEISKNSFSDAKWLLLTGYSFFSPELNERALEMAKLEGCKIALMLGSFEVVQNFAFQFKSLLQSNLVDLVFGNEEEILELWKHFDDVEVEAALKGSTTFCSLAGVATIGSKGCIICTKDELKVIRRDIAAEVKVVDTTGAGDLFCAGFLYGTLKGYSWEMCGDLGNAAGSAVVQCVGAQINEELAKVLKEQVKDLEAQLEPDSK